MNKEEKNSNLKSRLSSLNVLFVSFLLLSGLAFTSWSQFDQSSKHFKSASEALLQLEDENDVGTDALLGDLDNSSSFPSVPADPESNAPKTEKDPEESESEDTFDDDWKSFVGAFVLSKNSEGVKRFKQIVRSVQSRTTSPLYILFHSWKLHLI